MKDKLSKEHYCLKTHTLLMESSAYLPSIYIHHMDYPSFLQKNLDLPFYDFSKTPPL